MDKTQIQAPQYTPIPTIKLFHQCSAPYRCIVGPVGSAKTTGAALEVFYYIPRYLYRKYGIKRSKWAIIRNSYREIADTVQKTIMEWFPWGDYKASDASYTVIYPDDGIEVVGLFRSCDRPDDLKKFKSLEITGFWIDESIEVNEQTKLMLKNRIGRYPKAKDWPIRGHNDDGTPIHDVARFGIETTNPPDIEHPTYYQYDFKTDVPGPVPDRREKWQQVIHDHIGFWQPKNENVANLRHGYYTDLIKDYSGNPDWISRYVRGEPGVTVTGKPVYNNFRKSFHVSEAPLVWTGKNLFAGWDNTGNCPACVIIQVPTAGRVDVLAEYHTERMGIVDFVNMVVMDRNSRWPDAAWVEWGDPAGEAKFSKKGGGLTSNADLMRDEAHIILKPSEQNWEARRESVETQLGRIIAGESAILIDLSCIRLINGFMGGYCYPEIGTSGIHSESPLKNKYSHVHDALQYVMVMMNRNVRLESKKKKKKQLGNWQRMIAEENRNKRDGDYREVYVR